MGANDPQLELAHVLFIDIVGYSKRLINEQTTMVKRLNELVLQTEQCHKADSAGKLIRIPTGDGMALAFFTSPDAPVRCAMELSKADQADPKLELRMGIHTGPVDQVSDVNQRSNVTGAGINMAQRVMDCGDAGHILLSKHAAEDLEHYGQWQPLLHDLGIYEVKHGVRIGIVNFHNNEVGNPELPNKFRRLQKHRTRLRWGGLAAVVLLLGAIVAAFLFVLHRPARMISAIAEKSIAVLPFENLTSDKENAYFADGIQDQILTKLASMADLKVISRTSTAKYKSRPEDLRTVAQQLGVATVLEGTVQRAADTVRVNVQLIDARADSHLWAKTYDRAMKDIFAVESEVSEEIADALHAKLSPNESKVIGTVPTKDPEAYDLFLKGEYAKREALSSLKGEDLNQAANFYEQAIARDPGFVLARAALVESRMLRHHFGDALTANEVDEVGKMAEQAVRTAPDLAEAHIALGLFCYIGKHQYDQALGEFQRALALQPSNLTALAYSGGIHMRQGQWQSALAEYRKCEELDPRNPATADRIGGVYLSLRMWADAKRAASHALALDPHNVGGMHIAFFSYLCDTGDTAEAKQLLETFPPESETAGYTPGGFISIVGLNPYLSLVRRDYRAALKAWDNERSDPFMNRMRLVARTAIHVLAGDAASAVTEAETGRGLLEIKLREQPDDVDSMLQLSWINLALKRDAEALRLARQAAQIVPIEQDAVAGAFVHAALAEIEARTGQTSEAVETLRRLLAIPAGDNASIQRLKIDPVWDPIRNDPGFQQLLAGKELIGPNK